MRLVRPLLGLMLAAAPAVAFAQTSTTTPAMKPPAMTPPAMTAPSATPAPTATPMTPAGPGKMAGGAVGHYSTQADATAKCGSDTVVWANPKSKALHTSGSAHFGKTKTGFYACEKDAMSNGYHMAGTRKAKKAG